MSVPGFSGIKEVRGTKQARDGRPRTKEEIRGLMIRFPLKNDWGYTRIMGDLRKFGIKPASRHTVKNLVKENGEMDVLGEVNEKVGVTHWHGCARLQVPGCAVWSAALNHETAQAPIRPQKTALEPI